MSAVILGAGIASGLCGGFFMLNLAHSVAYGLTHLLSPEQALHGETVAVGLLVQAALANSDDGQFEWIEKVLSSWRLPTRLAGLEGVSPDDEFLDRLADLTFGYLDHQHAVRFEVTRHAVRTALARVASS